jgi:hypothetical protein
VWWSDATESGRYTLPVDFIAALATPATNAPVADVEWVAQFLHDEGGFGDAWTGHTWPEHPDDTGQREGGFVKIVPSDVQALFRDAARRLLISRQALPIHGEMREALERIVATVNEPDDHQGRMMRMARIARNALPSTSNTGSSS